MKIRNRGEAAKVEQQMVPMIDIIFQLLTFFLLTLKVIEPEGDFDINMPIGAPSSAQSDVPVPPLKVKLSADPAGRLSMLSLNSAQLGNDAAAFERLNREILNIVGPPGNPLAKDLEAEIDADYALHYQYVIRAVSACTGKLDRQSGSVRRYIEKIKFSPPKKPPA